MGIARESRRKRQGLLRRHRRIRKKISGSADRPRLVVHRSLKHIQGHLVDDDSGRVLLGIVTSTAEVAQAAEALAAAAKQARVTKGVRSRAAGKLLAEKARAAGHTRVRFDRGGYLYHGRVAAFAEGAREGGLEF